ncbi:MAG: hypothetical protein JRG95_13925 [Deltaproteobacteria bacterium]|nr:hypothetical protein [Deltaproteobacteria bacterium]
MRPHNAARPRRPWLPAFLTLVLALGCASTGSGPDVASPDPAPGSSAGTGTNPQPGTLPSPPTDVSTQVDDVDDSPTAGKRAQSAMEGMLIGAIVGAQAGPIGAAVGGVSLLLYGAITGEVPLSGGPSGSSSGGRHPRGSDAADEADLEDEIEQEIARQGSLEDEIQAELDRQEAILRRIDRDESLREAEAQGLETTTEDLEQRATETRRSPKAEGLRDLPVSIFDESRRQEDGRALKVRSLDADRDGAPEELRFFDETTGALVRVELDRDYDGNVDSWTIYQRGSVQETRRDNDGDGQPDEWLQFGSGGLATLREVDRDGDGMKDAFYLYRGGALYEERHDTDGDGTPDRILRYAGGQLTVAEEDTKNDGQTDTWTHYKVFARQEIVDRIEKDTTGDGKPDVFETYEQIAGRLLLKERGEDKNGDGEIDIRSIYEGGKLKQRQINDPALLPL